ncbi:hypothetical protein HK098_000421, partial [Nowakowskiella sp. JEL0407]
MLSKSLLFAAISSLLASNVYAQSCAPLNGQCGGKVFTGTTCCQSGYTCKYVSEWYSQVSFDCDLHSVSLIDCGVSAKLVLLPPPRPHLRLPQSELEVLALTLHQLDQLRPAETHTKVFLDTSVVLTPLKSTLQSPNTP